MAQLPAIQLQPYVHVLADSTSHRQCRYSFHPGADSVPQRSPMVGVLECEKPRDTTHPQLNQRQFRLSLAGLYPVEFRDFFLGDMYCSQTYTMGVSQLWSIYRDD